MEHQLSPLLRAHRRTKTLQVKYRSNFEGRIGRFLQKFKAEYEAYIVPYTLECNYWPDFRLPNGIFIEAKGRFTAMDRRKHLQVRRFHPTLDIRFVFYRATEKLTKRSKTTYADWCDKHGFKWAAKEVPMAWIKESGGSGGL